jgi:hypothetical protein
MADLQSSGGDAAAQHTAYVVAQQSQRIASLEELLRRNEGSLTTVLSRMKDSELALNNVHRVVGKIGPDLVAAIDELGGTKRRVDLVDHAWQAKSREVDQVIQNEVRGNRPPPLAQDPVFQRLTQEVGAARQELHENIAATRRVMEAAQAEGKLLRQVEQDGKWTTEQVRDTVSLQRDFQTQQTRRNEQTAALIAEGKRDAEAQNAQLKGAVEAAVKAVRDEMLQRFEQEARHRGMLQSDVMVSFGKMREDVVKGFGETATNLRHLDETSHSVETVLRAEVRSRMQAQEELKRRVDGAEERLHREAVSAAEYFKQMDKQMGGALRDVREITSNECKTQIEEVWRSVNDLKEQVSSGGAGSPTAAATEMALSRERMVVEVEVQKAKDDIVVMMEHRLATALAPMERLAGKSELQEVQTELSFKVQQLERQAKQKRVSVNAPADGGEFASQSSVKKLITRLESAERQTIVVAEAVRDVHDDLVDKMEKIETHASTIDAVHSSLKETFERDQVQMEAQVRAISEQVITLIGDDEGGNKPATAAAEGGEDGEEKPEGDEPERTTSPAMSESAGVMSTSGAVSGSHRVLHDTVHALQRQQTELQHEVRRDVTELRSQMGQVLERQHQHHKSARDDAAELRGDLKTLSQRVSDDNEVLQEGVTKMDRKHRATIVDIERIDETISDLHPGAPRRTTIAPADEEAAGSKPPTPARSEQGSEGNGESAILPQQKPADNKSADSSPPRADDDVHNGTLKPEENPETPADEKPATPPTEEKPGTPPES